MKCRNVFVSNSSCTSFIFITATNDKDEIMNTIKQYDQFFDIYSNDGFVTHEQVFDRIEESLEYSTIDSLDDRLNQLEDEKDSMLRINPNLASSTIMEMFEIEGAIDMGFSYVFEVDFCDDSGGELDRIMCSVGRNLYIPKRDLFVYTKENR